LHLPLATDLPSKSMVLIEVEAYLSMVRILKSANFGVEGLYNQTEIEVANDYR